MEIGNHVVSKIPKMETIWFPNFSKNERAGRKNSDKLVEKIPTEPFELKKTSLKTPVF
jgi:hypothetical protein